MNRFLLIFGIVILAACNRPEEEPEFLRVDNIKVTKVTGKEAFLNGDAFFYNTNDVRMKLKAVDIDIEMEGKKIGTINHKVKTRIPAKSEFKVPLDATFDIRDIGLLNGIISVLGGKKVKVHYTGKIKVAVYGITYNVPIDYDDEVRL